jgi:hypothetical protein
MLPPQLYLPLYLNETYLLHVTIRTWWYGSWRGWVPSLDCAYRNRREPCSVQFYYRRKCLSMEQEYTILCSVINALYHIRNIIMITVAQIFVCSVTVLLHLNVECVKVNSRKTYKTPDSLIHRQRAVFCVGFKGVGSLWWLYCTVNLVLFIGLLNNCYAGHGDSYGMF